MIIEEAFFSGRLVALITAMLAGFAFVVGISGIRFQKRKEREAWRDEVPPLIQAVQPLVQVIQKRINIKDTKREETQKKLNAAGLDYSVLPDEFVVLHYVGLVFGIVLSAFLFASFPDSSSTVKLLFAAVVPLGYLYPDIWLRDVVKARQHLYAKQFPFFLDLLTLSMRAGLTFPSALAQSVEKLPEGPVKTDFERLDRETRTGVSRREALLALAKRNDQLAVTNFVASVNQAEESGAVLGDVLTAQARQRRTERFLKAEKLAGEAPVKMLLPLMALLFPITFIIIGFPIVMKFMNSPAANFFN